MPFASRLLSVGPRIEQVDGRLVASTAWRVRLLTLGMLSRRVVVDPKKETVLLRNRSLWFFLRRRRLGFGAIKAVTYGYEDLTIGASWRWAHHSSDLFRVGLRLHDFEDIHLFSFYGEGTFGNNGPLPDWFYLGDYALDWSGTQESDSRAFVELLSRITGVSIEPSR